MGRYHRIDVTQDKRRVLQEVWQLDARRATWKNTDIVPRILDAMQCGATRYCSVRVCSRQLSGVLEARYLAIVSTPPLPRVFTIVDKVENSVNRI